MARYNIFAEKSPPGIPTVAQSGGGTGSDVNVVGIEDDVSVKVDTSSGNYVATEIVGWGDRVRSAFYRLKTDQSSSEVVANHYSPAKNLFWDEMEMSGDGTSGSHLALESAREIAVSNATPGRRVRQTVQRGIYENGKGLTIILTCANLATSAGNTKRVGYFDDDNGVFFEDSSGVLGIVVRNNGTDNRVNPSSWNGNILDGTDPIDPVTLDRTKINIFFIDIEWLGAGTVRFGVVIDGTLILCHKQNHANIITNVYMRTPNLPVRYEIENNGTGSADSLKVICCAVQSDGGLEAIGLSRGVVRFDPFALGGGTSGDWFPLISLRLNPLADTTPIVPLDISITPTTNANFSWALLLNDPSSSIVGGTDNASWQSLLNSSIQYDFSRNTSNILTFSQSLVLLGGTGSTQGGGDNRNLKINWYLAKKLDGTVSEYILAVNPVNNNETFIGSIDFREIV